MSTIEEYLNTPWEIKCTAQNGFVWNHAHIIMNRVFDSENMNLTQRIKALALKCQLKTEIETRSGGILYQEQIDAFINYCNLTHH